MPEALKKNLHVPLPPELHTALRQHSQRLNTPATALAREAIEEFVERLHRAEIAEQIREYAVAVAGTEDDIDVELAEAGEDALLEVEE
jgi:predicted DNA-binding protein